MVKTKYSKVSFKGKEFFVGIDQGKNNWVLSVKSEDIALETKSVDPRPQTVYKYMSSRYPEGTYHMVYEAGYWGFWAQREFERLGCHCIVVNPADVSEKSIERRRRTDRSDARKLVREYYNGDLNALYIPDQESENFRTLVRYLCWCSKQGARVKTRIKSVLATLGVIIQDDYPDEASRYWSGQYIAWIANLELDNGPARDTLQFHLQELKEHRKRKADILKRLRVLCKESGRMNLIQLLCTIPGVGFQTAVVLQSELIDMKRFPTIDHLKAYAGLIPDGEESSDKRTEHGISRRRNRYLRRILVESSWVAIRNDPALFQAYGKLKKRMKAQDAIIRIAKKLLSRIRYVWLHKEPYQKGIV